MPRAGAKSKRERAAGRPRRNENAAWRLVDGEAVIVNLANGEYYQLNASGSKIWELCDGRTAADTIASRVAGDLGVAAAKLRPWQDRFLARLGGLGLLTANN